MSTEQSQGDDWLKRTTEEAIDLLAQKAADPAAHRAALEAWIAADPRRKRVYDEIEAEVDAAALAAGARRPRSALWPRVRGAAEEHPKAMISLAAALLLAVGSSFAAIHGLMPGMSGTQSAQSAVDSTGERLITGAQEKRSFTLSDGSVVTLDPGSVLTVAFTINERKLSLEAGSVRFKVEHNPLRPFVVWARGGTITATGTDFDVWLAHDGEVGVALTQGRIEVVTPHAGPSNEEPKPKTLKPGDQIYYRGIDESQRSALVRPVAVTEESSAMTERSDFIYVPLAQVIDELNRDGALHVELADPSLGSRSVLGFTDHSNPLGYLRGLAKSQQLELIDNGSGYILRSEAAEERN